MIAGQAKVELNGLTYSQPLELQIKHNKHPTQKEIPFILYFTQKIKIDLCNHFNIILSKSITLNLYNIKLEITCE